MKMKCSVVRSREYWLGYYWMLTPERKKAAFDSLQKEFEYLQMQLEILHDLIAEDEALEVQ